MKREKPDERSSHSRRTEGLKARMKGFLSNAYMVFMKILCITASMLGLIADNAQAANWFVRPSSAGGNTGTDWNNAWSFGGIAWTSIRAGDSIFVAGGAYSNLNPGTSGTSGGSITIQRASANAVACTSAAGWSSAFDAQVSVGPTDLGSSDYITIDGVLANGIVFSGVNMVLRIGNNPSPGRTGVTISHCEITSSDPASGGTANVGLFLAGSTGCVIDHCYIHHLINGVEFLNCNNCIFQYNEWNDINQFGTSAHPNASYTSGTINCTFKYNYIHGTSGGSMTIAWEDYPGDDNTYLYGNVFRNELANNHNGIETDSNIPLLGHFYIYNNTFVDCGAMPLRFVVPPASGSIIENNLFYNTMGFTHWSGTTYDYNFSDSTSTLAGEVHSIGSGSNPFVNYSGGDYRIVSAVGSTYPRDKGVALAATYSTDPNGVLRGADGAWDIGAYEYNSVTTNPVLAVSPSKLSFGSVVTNTSTNLSFTVQNNGSGTLAGTASAVSPFSIVSGSSYSLGANQSQTVTVGFSPKLVGVATGTVTFTGGGGAIASVSGTGLNPPPTVSAITQSVPDVDPSTSGLQVYSGSVVQYSASAADPSGLPITWQWIYTINGGSEVILQSGVGTVPSVSYTYDAGSAGNTFVWKLRISNGVSIAESDLTIGVEAPPPPAGSFTFQAGSGSVTTPFVISNGVVSQNVDVSNSGQAGVTNGGQAIYTFNISTGGSYTVSASVDAPNEGTKSFWVNMDALPTDPTMVWDIYPYTVGFETRTVSWRGSGSYTNDQYTPQVFNLPAGTHQLFIIGREAHVQFGQITISPSAVSAPSPPQNLHILAGP